MNIRNSLKLLINNFSNVWKVLLYKLIVFLIALGFAVGLVLPNIITIISNIADTGIFENIKKTASDFFTRGVDITSDIQALKNSLEQTSAVLAQNAGRLSLSYIFILAILIFTNLLSGLTDLVICDIMNANMSSNAKFSFSSRFIITLGKNLKYQLVRLLTEIPMLIIITYVVWLVFSVLFTYIAVFSIFFAFVAYIILFSAYQTFFCCWLPELILGKSGTFDSIRIGFSKQKKILTSLFSSYILIYISLFFINTVLAFFTCGAGLLLSIPMSTMFIIIFRLVNYYEISELKYYIDSGNIISPEN